MASQLGYMFEISGRSQSLTSEIDFGCAANYCSRFSQPAVTCAEQPDAHCKVNDRMGTPRTTGRWANRLLRRALGQNALQRAAVHVEAARRLGDVAPAKLVDALDVLPTHPIGRHRIFR